MAKSQIWPFESQTISILDGEGVVPIGDSDSWTPNQITSWDQVILGDFILPGICRINGLSRNRKYQIVKNKETHYGEVKDLNLELATFSIENTIIESQDLDTLVKAIQFFESKLGVSNSVPANTNTYKIDPVTGLPVNTKNGVVTGTMGSVSIVNPLLRIRDISSVFITGIEGPVPYRVGKLVTTFKCIEVRKPIQSTSKSVKPKSSVAKGDIFDDLRTPEPSKDAAVLAP